MVKSIRTVNEEPCRDCTQITNAYDPMMGRLCPQCMAQRCANFAQNLGQYWQSSYLAGKVTDIEPASLDYLSESNKYLLTEPLVDHSSDIDSKKPEVKQE